MMRKKKKSSKGGSDQDQIEQPPNLGLNDDEEPFLNKEKQTPEKK